METVFEKLFRKVRGQSTQQIIEIIKHKYLEEEKEVGRTISFVAQSVLEERHPEFYEWRVEQCAKTGKVPSFIESFEEWFYQGIIKHEVQIAIQELVGA